MTLEAFRPRKQSTTIFKILWKGEKLSEGFVFEKSSYHVEAGLMFFQAPIIISVRQLPQEKEAKVK